MTTEAATETITEITAADIVALVDALPELTDDSYAERLARVLSMAITVNSPTVLKALIDTIPASARGATLTTALGPVAQLLAVNGDDLELDGVATDLHDRLGAPKKVIVEQLKKLRKIAKKTLVADPNKVPDGGFVRGDHVEIAARLVTDLGGAADVVFDDGEIHVFDGITWQPVMNSALEARIGGYAGLPRGADGVLCLSRSAVTGSREQAEVSVAKPGWFRAGEPGFAFKNGFVRIQGDGKIDLVPHTREQRSIFRYDFDWVGDSEPMGLINFYAEVFKGDPEAAIKTQFLLEFYGASLIGEAWRAGKAVIKAGPGNDGKSVETQIMSDVFPEGSVSNVSPHDWANDQKLASLAGKRLNYAGELSSKELRDPELFKAVVTGRDKVVGKVVYRPPFDFYSRAGHVMNINPPMPAVSDVSRGFYRRWEIVEFTRSFEPHEERAMIVEEVLADRQGIASVLIRAAAQFVGNGYKYTEIPASSELLKMEWMSGSEPVRRWVNEHCLPAVSNKSLSADELWSAFRDWAVANGHAAMSSATFRGRLNTIVRDLARTQPKWATAAGLNLTAVKKCGYFGESKFPIQFRLSQSTEFQIDV